MDVATSRSRDIAYQLHPFTNLERHESEGPLVITSGKGVYVYDEAGGEYIEGLAGLRCTALGFGHGYTYTGHPAACAVALEVLDIYEERACWPTCGA